MDRVKVQYFIKQGGESKLITKKEFFRLRDEEVKNNYVSKQRFGTYPIWATELPKQRSIHIPLVSYNLL